MPCPIRRSSLYTLAACALLTGIAGCGGGEVVAVDEADARLHGVDTEAGPGDVEERHGRKDDEIDVVVCIKKFDATADLVEGQPAHLGLEPP